MLRSCYSPDNSWYQHPFELESRLQIAEVGNNSLQHNIVTLQSIIKKLKTRNFYLLNSKMSVKAQLEVFQLEQEQASSWSPWSRLVALLLLMVRVFCVSLPNALIAVLDAVFHLSPHILSRFGYFSCFFPFKTLFCFVCIFEGLFLFVLYLVHFLMCAA